MAGQQLELEGCDHRPGDLVLDSEHVGELAVVGLRPQVIAVGRVDELRGDADLIARLAHAALEHGGDVQLVRDVAHILVLALEGERRGARRHPQAGNLGEKIQQLFGEAV